MGAPSRKYPAVVLDDGGLAEYWGAVAMVGISIPADCSAGIVSFEKSKILFSGINSSAGERVVTPTAIGGLTAAMARFCVTDPPGGVA